MFSEPVLLSTLGVRRSILLVIAESPWEDCCVSGAGSLVVIRVSCTDRLLLDAGRIDPVSHDCDEIAHDRGRSIRAPHARAQGMMPSSGAQKPYTSPGNPATTSGLIL